MPFKDPNKHRKESREYCRKWRTKNLDQARAIGRKNYNEHKEEYKERSFKLREKYKLQIFELLGNKCANPNCPIPREKLDIRALQIDHVKGNGCKDSATFCTYACYLKKVLEKIQNGSKDYQLLCANCNWLKRYENQEIQKSYFRSK